MDREKMILNRMVEHYDYLIEHGYEVVCLMLQGSQNYELDIYSDEYMSDIDTKAIVLPSFKDFVYGYKPISTTIVLENNEHIDVKDVRIMFDTYLKMNINFIETLYTKFLIINGKYKDIVQEIFDNADVIANINHNQALRCISGMSKEKLNALKHPYPTIIDKIDKYGYDPKQLHHIIRMNFFIKEYVKNFNYGECLISKDKEFLMDVKKGFYLLEDAEKMAYFYDSETYEIKNKHLLEKDLINQEGIDLLNKIKYDLLEFRFKEEL